MFGGALDMGTRYNVGIYISTIFSQVSLSLVYIKYGALDVSDKVPDGPPDRAPRELVKHTLQLFSALDVLMWH